MFVSDRFKKQVELRKKGWNEKAKLYEQASRFEDKIVSLLRGKETCDAICVHRRIEDGRMLLGFSFSSSYVKNKEVFVKIIFNKGRVRFFCLRNIFLWKELNESMSDDQICNILYDVLTEPWYSFKILKFPLF